MVMTADTQENFNLGRRETLKALAATAVGGGLLTILKSDISSQLRVTSARQPGLQTINSGNARAAGSGYNHIFDNGLEDGYERTVDLGGRNVNLRIFGLPQNKLVEAEKDFLTDWQNARGFFKAENSPYDIINYNGKPDGNHFFFKCDSNFNCTGNINADEFQRPHEIAHAFNVVRADNGQAVNIYGRVFDEAVANYYNFKLKGRTTSLLGTFVEVSDRTFNGQIEKTDTADLSSYNERMRVSIRAVARIDDFAAKNGHPNFLSQILQQARQGAMKTGRMLSMEEVLEIASEKWPTGAEKMSLEIVLFQKTSWESPPQE